MIDYLFDTSVAVEFYRPKRSFTPVRLKHNRPLKEHITEQQFERKATLYLPSFCVAETKNTLARWRYREKNVFSGAEHYKSILGAFIAHVHNREFFYSYDLNRYHNLNADEVIPVEQKTPIPEGQRALSSLDILVIAQGIELKQAHGREVHLLTADRRMFEIAKLRPEIFPKPYYWFDLKVSDLPTA